MLQKRETKTRGNFLPLPARSPPRWSLFGFSLHSRSISPTDHRIRLPTPQVPSRRPFSGMRLSIHGGVGSVLNPPSYIRLCCCPRSLRSGERDWRRAASLVNIYSTSRKADQIPQRVRKTRSHHSPRPATWESCRSLCIEIGCQRHIHGREKGRLGVFHR